jgi:hypothetical protein
VAIRVWHDNAGLTMNTANWFLKHVVIHDLTSKKKYFFICERWLGVERDDGLIERMVPAAGEEEKADLNRLAQRRVREMFNDFHLWWSLIARPVVSSFERLDRLTCLAVFLFVAMMIDTALYFLRFGQSPAQQVKKKFYFYSFDLLL